MREGNSVKQSERRRRTSSVVQSGEPSLRRMKKLKVPLCAMAILACTAGALWGIQRLVNMDPLLGKKETQVAFGGLGQHLNMVGEPPFAALQRQGKPAFGAEAGVMRHVNRRSQKDIGAEMDELSDYLTERDLVERMHKNKVTDQERQEAKEILKRLSILGEEAHALKNGPSNEREPQGPARPSFLEDEDEDDDDFDLEALFEDLENM